MKSIQLPQLSHEAVMNGASRFILPLEKLEWKNREICINEIRQGTQVSFYYKDSDSRYEGADGELHRHCYIIHIEKLIKANSPLQIEDEFYLQEPYFYHGKTIWYVFDCDEFTIMSADENVGIVKASKMTPEQSRYKKNIVNVEVKRGQELTTEEIWEMVKFKDKFWTPREFKEWYNQQYNNYDQNPYVFIYTVEE